MDPYTETGSLNLDASTWPHSSKSLQELLTEICQKAQRMLKLVKNGQPESTEILLTLYQSLGETYNHLNQELLNSLLKLDIKPSSSDKNSVLMADLSSFSSPSLEFDLESGVSYSSLKQLSPRRKNLGKEQSSKLNDEDEKEKNHSAYSLADIFSAELGTALRDLEERNRVVGELGSKLSDSSDRIKTLERELDECHELLEVSEVEVSKLNEMLSECKTEKADHGGADLLWDSLRAELRSRDVQIEQMEEYLNQVCVKDTEIVPDESGTDKKNVLEELKPRVEKELENQVKQKRNVIYEREEEEKREATIAGVGAATALLVRNPVGGGVIIPYLGITKRHLPGLGGLFEPKVYTSLN